MGLLGLWIFGETPIACWRHLVLILHFMTAGGEWGVISPFPGLVRACCWSWFGHPSLALADTTVNENPSYGSMLILSLLSGAGLRNAGLLIPKKQSSTGFSTGKQSTKGVFFGLFVLLCGDLPRQLLAMVGGRTLCYMDLRSDGFGCSEEGAREMHITEAVLKPELLFIVTNDNNKEVSISAILISNFVRIL